MTSCVVAGLGLEIPDCSYDKFIVFKEVKQIRKEKIKSLFK